MEELSNDYHKVLKRAEMEVSDFSPPPEEKMIASFSVFPFFGFTHKIFLLQNEAGDFRSIFKQWDTEYDMGKWQTGIYNLDRLRIVSNEHLLSNRENEQLKEILQQLEKTPLPGSLNKANAIVVDGADFYLNIHHHKILKEYYWRAASDEIEKFEDLIEFLVKLHSPFDLRNRHR